MLSSEINPTAPIKSTKNRRFNMIRSIIVKQKEILKGEKKISRNEIGRVRDFHQGRSLHAIDCMLIVPSSYDERTVKLKRMAMTELIEEVVFAFSHDYRCMLSSETLGTF